MEEMAAITSEPHQRDSENASNCSNSGNATAPSLERRKPAHSLMPLRAVRKAYKYLISRVFLNLPVGDSRIHSCAHSRSSSASHSPTLSSNSTLDTELLKTMLGNTGNGVAGSGRTYGTKTNKNGKWACKCILALITILFIAFWCVIIFYASRRDQPLKIEVSDSFELPDINQNYNRNNPRIPLLFHQMWKSPNIPEKWKAAHEGCTDLNSEYQLILWTDEMIYNFIARYYPWFYNIFINYPYHIQRVDVARYFLLYHYGGVYLDMDAACKTPFRDIVRNMSSTENVLLPMTDIYGVTNSFMVAAPHSDFFKFVIYELPTFAHGSYSIVRHTTIIFSTGPMFMSHCVSTFRDRGSIHVMTLSDYDERHFFHAKGGSWHGMDTEIVDAFHFHYVELLLITALVLLTLAVCKYSHVINGWRTSLAAYCPASVCGRTLRGSRSHSRNGSADYIEVPVKDKTLMV